MHRPLSSHPAQPSRRNKLQVKCRFTQVTPAGAGRLCHSPYDPVPVFTHFKPSPECGWNLGLAANQQTAALVTESAGCLHMDLVYRRSQGLSCHVTRSLAGGRAASSRQPARNWGLRSTACKEQNLWTSTALGGRPFPSPASMSAQSQLTDCSRARCPAERPNS